jgi:hypothetical protein
MQSSKEIHEKIRNDERHPEDKIELETAKDENSR